MPEELDSTQLSQRLSRLAEIKWKQHELELEEKTIRDEIKAAIDYEGGFKTDYLTISIAAPKSKLIIIDKTKVPKKFWEQTLNTKEVNKYYADNGVLPAGIKSEVSGEPQMRVVPDYTKLELYYNRSQLEASAPTTKARLVKVIGE